MPRGVPKKSLHPGPTSASQLKPRSASTSVTPDFHLQPMAVSGEVCLTLFVSNTPSTQGRLFHTIKVTVLGKAQNRLGRIHFLNGCSVTSVQQRPNPSTKVQTEHIHICLLHCEQLSTEWERSESSPRTVRRKERAAPLSQRVRCLRPAPRTACLRCG